MIRFVVNIFREPVNRDKRIEEFTRFLVRKYSSGNISLRMGRYITKKEAQKRKETVLQYKFI